MVWLEMVGQSEMRWETRNRPEAGAQENTKQLGMAKQSFGGELHARETQIFIHQVSTPHTIYGLDLYLMQTAD